MDKIMKHGYKTCDDKKHLVLDDKHSPLDDEHSPSDDEHSPSDDEHSPSDDEHSPSDDEHSLSGNEHSPSDVEHSPSDDAHLASDVRHLASNVEHLALDDSSNIVDDHPDLQDVSLLKDKSDGDKLSLLSGEVILIYPRYGSPPPPPNQVNNCSIMLLAHRSKILLTADTNGPLVHQYISDKEPLDFLGVPHHGSYKDSCVPLSFKKIAERWPATTAARMRRQCSSQRDEVQESQAYTPHTVHLTLRIAEFYKLFKSDTYFISCGESGKYEHPWKERLCGIAMAAVSQEHHCTIVLNSKRDDLESKLNNLLDFIQPGCSSKRKNWVEIKQPDSWTHYDHSLKKFIIF